MQLPIRHAGGLAVLALALGLGGCATTDGPAAKRDPLEPMNRAIHSFNDHVDRAVLKPTAQAYQNVVPQTVRFLIGNVFSNLEDLWTGANQLLQGKPREAASDLTRVMINSVFGLGGMADIATELGLPKHYEDFGQTLGVWGVPSGPYLVLPFFGPSSFRDAPSRLVDAWGDPLFTIDSHGQRNNAYALRVIDTRAELLRSERVVDEAAIDRYSFIRDGWLQRRRSQIYDGDPPAGDDDEYDPYLEEMKKKGQAEAGNERKGEGKGN